MSDVYVKLMFDMNIYKQRNEVVPHPANIIHRNNMNMYHTAAGKE